MKSYFMNFNQLIYSGCILENLISGLSFLTSPVGLPYAA